MGLEDTMLWPKRVWRPRMTSGGGPCVGREIGPVSNDDPLLRLERELEEKRSVWA